MYPQLNDKPFVEEAERVILETPSEKVIFADSYEQDGEQMYRAILLLDDQEQFIIFLTPDQDGKTQQMKVSVDHVATLMASIFSSVRNAASSMSATMFVYAMKAIMSGALPEQDHDRLEGALTKLLGLANGELRNHDNSLLQRFTEPGMFPNGFSPFDVPSEYTDDAAQEEEELFSVAASEIFADKGSSTIMTVDPETRTGISVREGDAKSEYDGLRTLSKQVVSEMMDREHETEKRGVLQKLSEKFQDHELEQASAE